MKGAQKLSSQCGPWNQSGDGGDVRIQSQEVPVNADGDVNGRFKACWAQTAGHDDQSIACYSSAANPKIAKTAHDAGGLLYYDGANLNAILGKVKPGDMGDVLLNLHKTFATPYGGGGPGAGPVGVSERLCPIYRCQSLPKKPSGRRRSAALSLVRVR